MSDKEIDNVVYDESGELRSGVFYEFYVPFDDGDAESDDEYQQSWVVSKRNPTAKELLHGDGMDLWLWLEVTYEECRDIDECPADKLHVNRHYYNKHIATANGGPRISQLVSDVSSQIMVNNLFADQLKAAKLLGF